MCNNQNESMELKKVFQILSVCSERENYCCGYFKISVFKKTNRYLKITKFSSQIATKHSNYATYTAKFVQNLCKQRTVVVFLNSFWKIFHRHRDLFRLNQRNQSWWYGGLHLWTRSRGCDSFLLILYKNMLIR